MNDELTKLVIKIAAELEVYPTEVLGAIVDAGLLDDDDAAEIKEALPEEA